MTDMDSDVSALGIPPSKVTDGDPNLSAFLRFGSVLARYDVHSIRQVTMYIVLSRRLA